MPRLKDKGFITFNDGTMEICRAKDRKIVETKLEEIRFGFQTVGIKRFYEAKLASKQVDEVVAIPMVEGMSTMDICIINGSQYKIGQIQKKYDTIPPCKFLSLEENKLPYEDVRE